MPSSSRSLIEINFINANSKQKQKQNLGLIVKLLCYIQVKEGKISKRLSFQAFKKASNVSLKFF